MKSQRYYSLSSIFCFKFSISKIQKALKAMCFDSNNLYYFNLITNDLHLYNSQ